MNHLLNFLKSLCVFLLLFSVCLSAQDITKKTEKQLTEISDIMERAVLDGNNLSTLDYYTDDIIICPGFAPAIEGIEDLKKTIEKNLDQGLKYHSFSGTVKKRWRCKNQIFEQGTFGMSITNKKLIIPKAYHGSYFQIWEEVSKGKFKISYIIWNLDFYPCG